MGFYIVDGLGHEPWTISVYAGLSALVVILTNRAFARRLDLGANPFPMIGIAAAGFLIAAFALSQFQNFWAVVTFGVLGFGIGASAMSTMFSLGGTIADRNGIKRSSFNAHMRATTSMSWMIGPALSFVVADRFGGETVFKLICAIAIIWLLLWLRFAPRDAATGRNTAAPDGGTGNIVISSEMWTAIAFVFCLALAHSLTFSALPIFLVQEVGLPGFAPGTAFTLKTFVELFAILSTPLLIARFGIRLSLLATSQLAVASILVLATVQSYPHMLVGAALEGFYFGLFSTLAISFVQSLSEDRPAYATAMYWNTMMVTLVVAGPAAGLIAQLFEFRTVIFVASGFAMASTVILGMSFHRRRSRAR